MYCSFHPLTKKTPLNASHTHFTDIPHTNIDATIIVKFRIEYKRPPRFFSLHISLHISSAICSQPFPTHSSPENALQQHSSSQLSPPFTKTLPPILLTTPYNNNILIYNDNLALFILIESSEYRKILSFQIPPMLNQSKSFASTLKARRARVKLLRKE